MNKNDRNPRINFSAEASLNIKANIVSVSID